jgi:hypothetical protein
MRLDQIKKAVEQRRHIVWARARLGVTLKTEGGFIGAFHRLQATVEQ